VNYYQVGKVFRTQNVISATEVSSKGIPRQDEFKNDKDPNVFFHISSQQGREVEEHLPIGSQID